MFFEIHNENKIGYKALTDADLGFAGSHQTHIGLFDDVLSFLPNHIDIDDALFIYDNSCTPMFASFDRIEKPDGTFRSPKIKVGGRNAVSIASKIRETVRENPTIAEWYLFWFGLKNDQPVFFLFNNESHVYKDIINMGIVLNPMVRSRLTNTTPGFNAIMKYLEDIVNTSGENIIRELEITSQTGVAPKGVKLRPYDIKKARDNFEKIGRKGEELVNLWLGRLKLRHEIETFVWFNETGESGAPYDFSIQELSGNIIYLDVKSTSLGFEQQIVFSNQELNFISETENEYHIYRIYDIDKEEKHIKICKNYKPYASALSIKINNFVTDIQHLRSGLQTAKIIVPTINESFAFDNEIIIA